MRSVASGNRAGWSQGNVNFANDELLHRIPAEFGEFGTRIAGSDGLPWKKATTGPKGRRAPATKAPSDAAAEASGFHGSFRALADNDHPVHSAPVNGNLSTSGSMLGESSEKGGAKPDTGTQILDKGKHQSLVYSAIILCHYVHGPHSID